MNASPFKASDFFKASGSGTGDCVEVAIASHTPDLVGLRDSKNPRGTVLLLLPTEWVAFVDNAARDGGVAN